MLPLDAQAELLAWEHELARRSRRLSLSPEARAAAAAGARELRTAAVTARASRVAELAVLALLRARAADTASRPAAPRRRGRPFAQRYTDAQVAAAIAAAGTVRAAARASGIPRATLSRRASHAVARDGRGEGMAIERCAVDHRPTATAEDSA